MFDFWKRLYLLKGYSWVDWDTTTPILGGYYLSDSISLWKMKELQYIEFHFYDDMNVKIKLTEKFIDEVMNGGYYG